jgi:hypothetical protein
MPSSRSLCGAAVVAALLGLAAPAWAAEKPAPKPEDLAQAAAESWLKLVDQGDYDASWEQAARMFKASVTKAQWAQACAAARGPLGKLLSRKVKSRTFADSLPGAPPGKYVVIQFEATYAARASAVETVTPMLDPDGAWRVSGYFVR